MKPENYGIARSCRGKIKYTADHAANKGTFYVQNPWNEPSFDLIQEGNNEEDRPGKIEHVLAHDRDSLEALIQEAKNLV